MSEPERRTDCTLDDLRPQNDGIVIAHLDLSESNLSVSKPKASSDHLGSAGIDAGERFCINKHGNKNWTGTKGKKDGDKAECPED